MSAARTILATAIVTTALLASGYYAMSRPAAPAHTPAAVPTSSPAAPAPVAPAASAAPEVVPSVATEAPAPAATPTLAPSSLEDIVSRAMPAVVRVEVNTAFGSGFFVRPDTVLTNVHVVTNNTTVVVRLQDGSTKPARVETTAPEFDIAVLRVVGTSPAQPTLTLGSATRARPGQEVIVLGTPMGLQNTVTRGIVSALRQTGQVTLVQTDAAVNPGNSGGPVLDREGNVLGIATMGLKAGVAQGLSFAVAIDHAQELLAGRHTTSSTETPLASLNQAIGAPPAPATAAPSESDARREAGSRAYDQAVTQIARKADELDRYWAQFRRVCYNGGIDGGFDREWFALFEPRAMKGSVAQGCTAQFADAQRIADEVRTGLVAADEAARRADVYPGTRRETLRRNRLDYQGWSR